MKRIEKIQARLDEWEVDLIVIENPIDLFYLTNQDLSAGRLIVEKSNATLYVDGRYYESCKKNLTIPVVLHTQEKPIPTFERKRIGFDAHTTTFEDYEKLINLKGERIPLISPMQSVRAIKEPEEIILLKQAAELGSKGYDFVLSLLDVGISEEEVALELELFWRKAGGERLAFAPHIAFGENSAYPHYHSGKRRLKSGDIVLIDIGVVLNHYHSDMTRVFFGIKPPPSTKLIEIYRIVHEAQEKALEMCKPGIELAELDRVARAWIEAKGFGPQFLHSLGHGVGLEIHEAPVLRKNAIGRLEEGMVITIEPGIYLPGIGGVRLEDTILITRDGFENMTNRPIHIFFPCF